MTTLNIALPKELKVFVEGQVVDGSYSTISEYVRYLIREAQKHAAQMEFENLILEGLDSPSMTKEEFFGSLRERIEERRDGKRQLTAQA